MAKRPITAERMLDRALDLIAREGWTQTSLADMAAAAEVPLGTFLRHYPSKAALLNAFSRRVDSAMLVAAEGVTEGEGARDRLFEVVMRRFDAMRPDKEAVRAIARDIGRRPLALACRSGRVGCSMALTLEAAGLGSSGPGGLVRIKGLVLIYLEVLRAWLGDDSEDMGKTMAALDRRLRQADQLIATLCRLPGGRRRGRGANSAAEPEPA